MRIELIENKFILYPETQFEAQWLNSEAGRLTRWDWFDDRGQDKSNLDFCGIDLSEVSEEEKE